MESKNHPNEPSLHLCVEYKRSKKLVSAYDLKCETMAGKLIFQAPDSTYNGILSIPKTAKLVIIAQKLAPTLKSTNKCIRLFEPPSGFRYALKCTDKVAGDGSRLFFGVGDDMDVEENEKEPSKHRTVDLIKAEFYQAIEGN